jgi:hypothetical protein
MGEIVAKMLLNCKSHLSESLVGVLRGRRYEIPTPGTQVFAALNFRWDTARAILFNTTLIDRAILRLEFRLMASIEPSGGLLAAVPVFVRISATAAVGPIAGSITHTGGGAPTQNLALSGTVSAKSGPVITSIRSGSIYAGGTFGVWHGGCRDNGD